MIRLTRQQLSDLIREEFANGIPDFALRELSIDVSNKAKSLIVSFVQQRAESESHAREIMVASEEALQHIEDDVYDVLIKRLGSFVRYV